MDADTRHHLKQNELAEALQRIDFSDKRLWYWAAAIIIIALLYFGYRIRSWQSGVEQDQQWATLSTINAVDTTQGDAPLDQLRQLISETADGDLGAIARLNLAQGLWVRGELGDDARRSEATSELDALLSSGAGSSMTRAAALFLRAKMYESTREFDKARETYLKLSTDEEFAGIPYRELATQMMESLDELATPVVFTPGIAPPPPPPSTAPTSSSAPASAASGSRESSEPPTSGPAAPPAGRPAPTSKPAAPDQP